MTRHSAAARVADEAYQRRSDSRTASTALRRGQRAASTTSAMHGECDGQLDIFDALDTEETQR